MAAGYWLRFVLSRGWRLLNDEPDNSISSKVESVTSQT
jgi:hypothetical protein